MNSPRLFLYTALLGTSLSLIAPSALAAEEKKSTSAAPATADELWARLEKVEKPPEVEPKSREEMVQIMKDWLQAQSEAAQAFLKKYPEDPRQWHARVVEQRTAAQQQRLLRQGEGADPKVLDQIVNAPEASEQDKGEAAFLKLMQMTAKLNESGPEAVEAFHQAAAKYLGQFPKHEMAEQVQSVQLQVISALESSQNEAILGDLAKSSHEAVAGQATAMLAQKKQMQELKTKPLELDFTSVDGKKINLADYRGKVVLIDFWASWCGPCIQEMPNVVKTYSELKDQGFAILGISLDQDKSAMEGALKRLDMTWPQYFDGEGWQNKISTRFGIQSIPAAWVLDKKGLLRMTDLRGEELAEGVKELLAE